MLRRGVCARASAHSLRSFSASAVTRAQVLDLSYPTSARPTPHEIFHLPRTASQDEIKDRYYELVRLHHPDSPACRDEPDEVRQERFKSITKAYEVLKCNRNPALLEEMRRRHSNPMHYYDYPTRRQQYAYRHPGRGSLDVGNGDVFLVVTILAIIGSVALMYSPMSASGRADRHHLSASQALAEARREGREYSMFRRGQVKKWVEEAGLEGAAADVGHGAPRPPPSSDA
ncbi:DnaJ-domain-containing protein [Calocera viscosa TUFC12733]|uniref:DnaJ-domain-containing protein n=1 Tax=Calocera viscosa (strain TUFC12733) TaxID=1330018 RepID=A0A167G2S8_CALVF|nr:DnaJ-domain-containing protein [Calocera viscosa TUFC12733]